MERYEPYLEEELPQPSAQNIVDEEELLAAQAAAEAAAAQQSQQPGGAFNNVGQGLTGRYRDMMMQYWQETINSIEHDEHDFKNHQLPLARIKKVMKTDEDVRMISAEAPILFAKGCDVFITELTMRAWIHAEEHKRRTLQKSDIAAALTKSDMFDFLIDVVPREEEKPKKSYTTQSRTGSYINSPTHFKSSSTTVPQRSIPGIPSGDLSKTNDVTSDQYSQQQQQNLLQQHLLQQQMLHQQHLQQQQEQEQEQQQQNQNQPQTQPQNQNQVSHDINHNHIHNQNQGQPQHIPTLTQQGSVVQTQPQSQPHDPEMKPKVEETENIPYSEKAPVDSEGDNYTGFQNFNPVEYDDFS
ncbi:hypothetical protein CAAN1_15S02498 [[Candida] anglica]|uniref:Core Histone H2A/H2B/H3 domain-containing protein n=1 Tax=[Candida] anglica TaxID=148631 RepID=A0ABP0E831_9ASCO